jgi:hypothetical protein
MLHADIVASSARASRSEPVDDEVLMSECTTSVDETGRIQFNELADEVLINPDDHGRRDGEDPAAHAVPAVPDRAGTLAMAGCGGEGAPLSAIAIPPPE